MLEGLPPNGAAHLMRVPCPVGTAKMLADVISETFDSAEMAAVAFQRDPVAATGGDEDWVVEVYFQSVPDRDQLRTLIASCCGERIAAAAWFGQIAQQEWIDAATAGLAPVRTSRFLICGQPESVPPSSSQLRLEIPAALAFGTGHHGTTLGCLLELESICRKRRPQRVLDLGTGTGILALATAKLIHRPVTCSDIDATAVRTAADNARRNDLAHWVQPWLATGVSHPVLRARAPYDLIFANILARPLRLLAPALSRLACGDIVLSGLLGKDVPGILSAYAAHGFALAQRRDITGWATLRVRRGGAAARGAPIRR
jgi:ribosomal protein L11 methyltransferase